MTEKVCVLLLCFFRMTDKVCVLDRVFCSCVVQVFFTRTFFFRSCIIQLFLTSSVFFF